MSGLASLVKQTMSSSFPFTQILSTYFPFVSLLLRFISYVSIRVALSDAVAQMMLIVVPLQEANAPMAPELPSKIQVVAGISCYFVVFL